MIRTLVPDVLRYGDYSRLGESIYDHPFQWGSKRNGPDLARVGGKYPNVWHLRPHGESALGLAGLEHAELPVAAVQRARHGARCRARSPSSASSAFLIPAWTDAEIAADRRGPGRRRSPPTCATPGAYVAPDREIIALIAYLQKLGKYEAVKPPGRAPALERLSPPPCSSALPTGDSAAFCAIAAFCRRRLDLRHRLLARAAHEAGAGRAPRRTALCDRHAAGRPPPKRGGECRRHRPSTVIPSSIRGDLRGGAAPAHLRRHPRIRQAPAELVAVHALRRDRVLDRLLVLLRVVPRRAERPAAGGARDGADRGGQAGGRWRAAGWTTGACGR